jgi:putative flavoprotein involved in K+ transport
MMITDLATRRAETVVIGAGQAGLSVGYHLRRRGVPFVILDANPRIGDSWRRRWDSLRLFTPSRYDGLPGMPFPRRGHYFPPKNEMADYLEAYARRFDLPVRNGVRVERLSQEGNRFRIETGGGPLEAAQVVVAMATYQEPYVPSFAAELDPAVVQIHSRDYRNPSQLRDGDVLIVGAGNSGSEIAMELARTRRVWLSGRPTGQIPFRIEGLPARFLFIPVVLRGLFHRVLTIENPLGRKVRRKVLTVGGPLIRVKERDLARAGVERVPRMAGVRDGLPALEDGSVREAANVVWCTGFRNGFSWIDLPVLGPVEPLHRAGIAERVPGLYFVGLHFLYSLSSSMIHAADRDARRIADAVAARASSGSRREEALPAR